MGLVKTNPLLSQGIQIWRRRKRIAVTPQHAVQVIRDQEKDISRVVVMLKPA